MKRDLTVNYMGFRLKNPLIVSSSDLTATPENIEKCAHAGASAVVLKSLFEEQILGTNQDKSKGNAMYQWYPEANDYINSKSGRGVLENYLRLIERTKKRVKIPVIASINCLSPSEWLDFAKKIEDAGADGLELNIAIFPFSDNISGSGIDQQYIEIVHRIKTRIKIPLAVKLGHYFSNIAQIASRLDNTGVDSLVLFNRFYRPDIDVEKMEITSGEIFSTLEEMAQPLRWIGLLSNKLACDLAASTGIHDGTSIIKQLLVGANATMVCSALYLKGIDYISVMLNVLEEWMERHDFESIRSFQGNLAQSKENTAAWERLQFMKKAGSNIYNPA